MLEAPKRLQRMLLAVQRYDIKVVYKPGSVQLVADMLSRVPSEPKPLNEMSKEQISKPQSMTQSQKRSIR